MLMRKNGLFARMRRFIGSPKARRGIAIEMAIMVIIITFGLSALIVSISIIQKSNKDTTVKELTLHTKLDEIGDCFCANVKEGTDLAEILSFLNSQYSDYAISAETANNTYTLKVCENTVTEGADSEVLLTVFIERSEGKLTITKWAYN